MVQTEYGKHYGQVHKGGAWCKQSTGKYTKGVHGANGVWAGTQIQGKQERRAGIGYVLRGGSGVGV